MPQRRKGTTVMVIVIEHVLIAVQVVAVALGLLATAVGVSTLLLARVLHAAERSRPS